VSELQNLNNLRDDRIYEGDVLALNSGKIVKLEYHE
jgi:hypothetical protein